MSLPATGGSLQPLEDHNPPERRFPAGFALVLVLCVLAVLSVIAVTLIRETREETRFEGAVIEDAKAEALAEGGIQQTMAELLTPPGNGAWEADGESHQIRLGEGVVVVRIEDESGRIDLNRADLATLESMLVSTGLPPTRPSIWPRPSPTTAIPTISRRRGVPRPSITRPRASPMDRRMGPSIPRRR